MKHTTWEEEFDEKFPNYEGIDVGFDGGFVGCYLSGGYCSTDVKDIKSFIRKKIEEARREGIKSALRFVPEEDGNFVYLSRDVAEFAKQVREALTNQEV